MEKVLYASTICSLMYARVCTRPSIAHAMQGCEVDTKVFVRYIRLTIVFWEKGYGGERICGMTSPVIMIQAKVL